MMKTVASCLVSLSALASCAGTDQVINYGLDKGKEGLETAHEVRQRVDRGKFNLSRQAFCGVGLDIWLENINKMRDLELVPQIICGANAKILFEAVKKKE